MKKRVLIVFVSLVTTAGIQAGDFNVVGNLNVASNLTASSVTLQGAKELTSPVLDFTQPGLFYRYTLTNQTTWTFTNHVAGRQLWLQITEDDTGGWTNYWPTAVMWPGGHSAHPSTGRRMTHVFKVLDDGSHWLALPDPLDEDARTVDPKLLALRDQSALNDWNNKPVGGGNLIFRSNQSHGN